MEKNLEEIWGEMMQKFVDEATRNLKEKGIM
jgi:hypothetical protein